MDSFDKVNTKVLPLFSEIAKTLEEKYGQEQALCRALSLISGYTDTVR